MLDKYKHYIIWHDRDKGIRSKYRSSHKSMERVVNSIINGDSYTKGSLRVIVGVEELKPSYGQELV